VARVWEVLLPRLHVAEAGPFGLEGAMEKVLRLLSAEGGPGAVLVAGPGAAVVCSAHSCTPGVAATARSSSWRSCTTYTPLLYSCS
jgi:hypothetical protein